MRGIVKLSERRFLIESYVNLLWESLFEVTRRAVKDPEEGYMLLRYVGQLLPMQVRRKVKLNFTEEDEEILERRFNYHKKRIISVTRAYALARKEACAVKVRKLLKAISEELEKMDLKWEVSAIPVAGEKKGLEEQAEEGREEEEGEELEDVEVHYVEEDSEGIQ